MKRIGILTAGGDTPALNATIYGAVERANALEIEIVGIINGFAGLLDPRVPHFSLNPLCSTIAELDPTRGGTLLGASRTYLNHGDPSEREQILERFRKLNIDGLICIGGDGTMNGMQSLAEKFPCVLAPKTIDNDLGLNFPDELSSEHDIIDLEEMVNYATPGYATAVFVVAQGVERIRTTAESHRRIAIIEVMGRQSGFIALGSAYGQPDIILIPEVPVDLPRVAERIRALYQQQQNVVIVIGEGLKDQSGQELGAIEASVDPAGNVLYTGAAAHLKQMLLEELGEEFIEMMKSHGSSSAPIFNRKVGHTQRGGRPILFDRFHATQLGGKAVDLLVEGNHNAMATLQWSQAKGFGVDFLPADGLRNAEGEIPPRLVHRSFYDAERFQPSELGREYLSPIFADAIGADDVEFLRDELFHGGKLVTEYRSLNTAVGKRVEFLG